MTEEILLGSTGIATILIPAAVVWLLFAFFSAGIASARGHSTLVWFCAGLLFGPFGLLVGFHPVDREELDRKKKKRQQHMDNQ